MTSQQPPRGPLYGSSRRSMRLGDRDPRARREVESKLNAEFVAPDGALKLDRRGRIEVDTEKLRARLEAEA